MIAGQAKREEMTIWLATEEKIYIIFRKHSHATFTYNPQDGKK
jgi:hypothetical protein